MGMVKEILIAWIAGAVLMVIVYKPVVYLLDRAIRIEMKAEEERDREAVKLALKHMGGR